MGYEGREGERKGRDVSLGDNVDMSLVFLSTLRFSACRVVSV